MLWLALALLGCPSANDEECSALSKVLVFDDLDADGFGDPTTEREACTLTVTTTPIGGDCNDENAGSYPEAPEQCDADDNDCDGTVDEEMPLKTWYSDYDGDGSGNEAYPIEACAQPENTSLEAGDCADDDASVNPYAREVCNGRDDDCDDRIDDADPSVDPASWREFYDDADGDGAGDPLFVSLACDAPTGTVDNDSDCDDDNPAISPTGVEVCNGEDDDCDGLWEESDPDLARSELITWYYDGDGDGSGDALLSAETCAPPLFYVANADDCDDSEPLLAEAAPWLQDTDADGFGAGIASADLCLPPGADWVVAAAGVDCGPTDPAVYPGAADPCGDTVDQNCDGFDVFCTVGLAETCAEAALQPIATTGTWPVSATLATDDIDVGANVCTDTASNGREGFVQVDLDPSQVVTLTHSANTDASPYLLSDCTLASSCVGGAENEDLDGTTETLKWQNASALSTTLFAVFDCADGGCTTADGQITVGAGPLLADTCAEAEGWTPLETGSLSLYGSLAGFANNMDLNMADCTGFDSAGTEGFLPVLVAPGQTLALKYSQPNNDASLYLLTDCNLRSSCVAGKDVGLDGDAEQLGWVNTGPTDTVVYVTFDCFDLPCAGFEATVTVF